jgi:Flp pilus assembly protein TadG
VGGIGYGKGNRYHSDDLMKKFLRNNHGGAMVEFALVSLPVVLFIFGIMQVAWIVWIDNLLQVSVDAAARCGAVRSTTPPCAGTDMIAAANSVFGPLSGASFSNNTSACSGKGVVGTYTITFGFVTNMTVTASSCFPSVS